MAEVAPLLLAAGAEVDALEWVRSMVVFGRHFYSILFYPIAFLDALLHICANLT